MIQAKNGILSNSMYFNSSIELLDRAHSLRNEATEAEDMLWQMIRNRQVGGMKFRRQHALAGFIADFYCHEAKLIIEVDGEIHDYASQTERDLNRTFELKKLGIKVLRFTNREVKNESNKVKSKILEHSLKK
jgi:very-short-patch-repair endonuclease